jgi:hypothetical protein
MNIRPFFISGVAHGSSRGEGARSCAAIDPSRDISRYIPAAKEAGLSITHIPETHLPAGFISGHPDRADATESEISAPRTAGVKST